MSLMPRPALAILTAVACCLIIGEAMPIDTSTQARTEKASEKDRWNLADLYPSDEAWNTARAAFEARIDRIGDHHGHLGESAARLLAALSFISNLQREYGPLTSYAHLKSDLDKGEAASLGRAQEIEQVGIRFEAAASFVAPEVLALPEGTVARLLKEEPRLKEFAHDLDDILRKRPHTLSPAEEHLLADAGTMASAADNVYGVLANADLPFPDVTLSSGEKVRLSQSAFVKYRTAPVRADRLEVFRAFFGTWTSFGRTFGVTLDAEVRKSIFYARARHYDSVLGDALDRNNVPESVYDAVVAAANEGLATLHRYLRLRARILAVPDLAYHDIYAPLVPSSSREYTIDEARKLVLAAVAPLGDEYVAALRKGYDSRWVDVWPSRGKRSGAYSNGSVYDSHPFILMNYSGNFDGVATLAHESGHAMHSHLASAAQPFPSADYPIFVAEVASTFNEALLYRYSIDHAKNDEERLSLLSAWLDGARGTFFRQAMFAEFERALYKVAERGESLTGDKLGGMYLDLIRRYHGSAKGVCAVDDLYRVEWAYIPHFYANYYVFQYATGFSASTSLARRVLAGEPGARDSYLDFLRAGGSDYPFELLKKAGVDLSTPEPYRETIAEMNRVMDQIDAILARRNPRHLPLSGGPC